MGGHEQSPLGSHGVSKSIEPLSNTFWKGTVTFLSTLGVYTAAIRLGAVTECRAILKRFAPLYGP